MTSEMTSGLYKKLPKNFKFASIYFIIAILLYTIFGIAFLDRGNRHKLMPNIPSSKEIVVVAIDEKTLQKYGSWPWPRETIARSIELILNYNPDVVGVDILFQENGLVSEKLNQILENPKVIVAKQVALTNNNIVTKTTKSAKLTGFVNYPLDSDGVVRRVVTSHNGSLSLAKEVYGKGNVPTTFLINPNSPLSQTISLSDLSDNPDLGKFLTNKKVLLGSTVLALGDAHTLPKYGYVPGVFIHSISLNQMIAGNFPAEPSINNFTEVFIILFLSTTLAFKNLLFKQGNFLLAIIISVSLIIATILFTANPFFSLEFLVANVVALILAVIILYTTKAYQQRKKLEKTLGLYVSDKVMQMVYKDPKIVDLGGELKNITILFTDIRNFTKMTEKFGKTTEFGTFLNKILDLQTVVIQENEGVVDKFIGDAVMAFWGAPVSTSKDSYYAIKSACEVVIALQEFNLDNKSELSIGIGVNSGQAIVGNFGSSKRFNYTAIGDSVNTAARLESLNKMYGTQILVGKSAIDSLSLEEKNCFKFMEIDTVCPKGKENSIILYQILSFKIKDGLDWVNLNQDFKFQEKYHQALQLYYKGRFNEAKLIFSSISMPASILLAKRCEYLIKQPGLTDNQWKGVWNHETK